MSGPFQLDRDAAYQLMCEYTANDSLRRHMRSVEIAMRAYAEKMAADPLKWGIVGLLHDFDYERWPDPPDHPLKGAAILQEHGYPEDMIYAIKSHANYMTDCPRISEMDKVLFACDELCGFIVACCLVRPEGIKGLQAKSVKKKLKQKSFAASVNRDDITDGAAELGVDLGEHIQFCIDALTPFAEELGLLPDQVGSTQT